MTDHDHSSRFLQAVLLFAMIVVPASAFAQDTPKVGEFGEAGIACQHVTSEAGSLFGEVSGSTWRIRSAVGAILYF